MQKAFRLGVFDFLDLYKADNKKTGLQTSWMSCLAILRDQKKKTLQNREVSVMQKFKNMFSSPLKGKLAIQTGDPANTFDLKRIQSGFGEL